MTWDSMCVLIREADDDTSGRYSDDEKALLHTARLLVDRRHPTQRMGDRAARQIAMALAEYHGATIPKGDLG